MQEQVRIWHLLGRKLADEASAKELEELEELLRKYPEITYPVDIMLDMWKPGKVGSRKEKQEVEDAFDRHLKRMAAKNLAAESTPAHKVSKARQTQWKTKSGKFELFSPGDRGMINNYFKVTWRNLFRHKAYSFINITGLGIGMASAILILLWIRNQLSYDQFHTKKDRIYMVYNRDEFNGTKDAWGNTPHPLGPQLKMSYPQVEDMVRLNWVGAFVFSAGDRHFETHGFVTDPGFLNMFDFPLLQGNKATALNDIHSVVLTEKMARKLFGDSNALGRTVKVDSNAHFTVTGVMKDLPNNTQFGFDYLIPWQYLKEVGWSSDNWYNNNIRTFLLLKPGVTEDQINRLIRNVPKAHGHATREVFVHPMEKWWLRSRFENGVQAGGHIESIRLFGFIAAFILLIACINYMNLSTARSVKRAKEVGIRKVVGAGKASLVWQFMGESIVISLVAGIIAMTMVQPALKWFNKLIGDNLVIPYTDLSFWLTFVAFILITGIIAGSYPAFYLSAFKPIKVLKGTFKAPHALVTPRKILVVFQFSFAIILIICTVVIHRQIKYAQQRDVGYDKNDLAFVYIKGDIKKNYPVIKNELLNSGAVTNVTRTNSPITYVWSNVDDYTWKGKDPKVAVSFDVFNADNDFTSTIGLKLVAGRDLDNVKYPSDSSAVLITESAAKLMGFDNPVGQFINEGGKTPLQIVGVIKDFIPGSPYHHIDPIVVHGFRDWFGALTFKLNHQHNNSENLARIAEVFKKYNPDYPFEYYFVDKAHGEKFGREQSIATISTFFSGLTIFISCLGLFALAAYMAENRIKEIGIRKVLGASMAAITTLLSKDFLKLVFIAFLVASPLAWWAMNSWLQHYAYRVNISWWIFAITGVTCILIAIATVSYQSIKAALSNPVKSLRTE